MKSTTIILLAFYTTLGTCLWALDPESIDSRGNWNLEGRSIIDSMSRIPRWFPGHLPLAGNAGFRPGDPADLPELPLPESSVHDGVEGLDIPSPEVHSVPGILDNSMVVGYYGHPRSTRLGVLGEQSIEETARLVKEKADVFDQLNGRQRVVPAFHLIYGTVWEDAGIGILTDEKVLEYINYAQNHGMVVILDHQLGKYSVEQSMKTLLPWLKYPCVHLAIDPEWSTLNPGKEIGTIKGEDVNKAMGMMEAYLEEIGSTTRRMFIVHQFNCRMISDRKVVKDSYRLVDLIHNADGYGAPALKLDTYRYVAQAGNMPLKGFKLFLPKTWKSAGYDKPLLTPKEVMQLKPRPIYINYQ